MSSEIEPSRARRGAAYSVHVLTASGGAAALIALNAAYERRFALSFAWLGLGLFIDGVDGLLARAARVAEAAPAIDGATLDLVIDFLTYVLVPVVALARSDLMPQAASFWLGLIVVVASALYFADKRMKTADHWFRGFPAVWNVFAFYLFVLRPPWAVDVALTLAATAMMFAPALFVHPLRVARLRARTLAATVVWAALALEAVVEDLSPPTWTKIGLVAIAVYFLALPLARRPPPTQH